MPGTPPHGKAGGSLTGSESPVGTSAHWLSCFHTPIYSDTQIPVWGLGGPMKVVVYGEVNEALPLLSLHLWEDGRARSLAQGTSPHFFTSFSQLSLQPAPTAPPPLQTPGLVTAKNKSTGVPAHNFKPQERCFQTGVTSLRGESGGFHCTPLSTRL